MAGGTLGPLEGSSPPPARGGEGWVGGQRRSAIDWKKSRALLSVPPSLTLPHRKRGEGNTPVLQAITPNFKQFLNADGCGASPAAARSSSPRSRDRPP